MFFHQTFDMLALVNVSGLNVALLFNFHMPPIKVLRFKPINSKVMLPLSSILHDNGGDVRLHSPRLHHIMDFIANKGNLRLVFGSRFPYDGQFVFVHVSRQQVATELVVDVHVVFALFGAGRTGRLDLGHEVQLAPGSFALLFGAVAAGLVAGAISAARAGRW